MELISKEKFKKSDAKVQEEIMKWWKPSFGDIVDVNGIIDLTIRCVEGKLFDCAWNNFKLGYHDVTPLLTVGQLIDFIQCRTGLLVCVDYDCDDIFFELKDFEQAMSTVEKFSHWDLLDGLWEVVCSVATNVRYDK